MSRTFSSSSHARVARSLLGSIAVGSIVAASLGGCGASPGRGADEPALADSAQALSLDAPLAGQLTPPCDRLAFSFRPTERGNYDWEVRSDVAVSLRLFAMSPDLYLATGSREGEVSRVSGDLDANVDYAVTVTPRECRAAPYEVAITRR